MPAATTPTKRGAPDGDGTPDRPTKRVAPSSPEEGELDDDSSAPGPSRSLNNDGGASPGGRAPSPAPPGALSASSSSTGRVQFPFKRKDAGGGIGLRGVSGTQDGGPKPPPGKMSYERPADFFSASTPPQSRGRGGGGGGGPRRFDPRAARGPYGRDRAPPPPAGGYGASGPGYDDRDRHYIPSHEYSHGRAPPRDIRGPWVPPPPPRERPTEWSHGGRDGREFRDSRPGRESPRGSDLGRDRDERVRGSTRSPTRSSTRSGSPRSPASPGVRREKHRLPDRRSPPPAGFSPLGAPSFRGPHGDRAHDSYMPVYGREWERERDYPRRRDEYRRPDYNELPYNHAISFEDPREGFNLNQRYDTGDYHRPRSPREEHHPRSRTPRGGDRYRPVDDSYRPQSPHAGPGAYRPVSPGREPPAPRPPPPAELEPRPSPAPDASPPSPLPLERRKDTTLPPEHAVVSISLSRHSLPSRPPPDNERGTTQAAEEVAAAGDAADERGTPKVQAPVKREVPPSPRKKRDPVHRTREQEKEAYGRMFTGCGKREDYDLTTKLGEGTFGEVHKAVQKATGRSVALKRILMHNEKDGMPVTALREIKILKAMKHPNVIDLLDMFVVRSTKDSPMSVYMAFPYMDHDLAGLLENERVQLTISHIKLYMKQLFEGTEYMHRNRIIHRDMKAANLLISNDGTLKIADFGLARAYDPTIVHQPLDFRGKERKYTNCVVTRWYRPPELLLGARQYGGEVDIWGIGCVLAEMFVRKPILPGASDLDQVERIYALCGTPNQHTWPNHDRLPGCEGVTRFQTHPRALRTVYKNFDPDTLDLLEKLLVCNPRERLSATQALEHDYFYSEPMPASLGNLPVWDASHELDKRSRRNHGPGPMAGPPGQPNGRPPHGHGPPGGPPPPLPPQPILPQLPTLRFTGGPPPRELFRAGGYRGGPQPPMPGPGPYGAPGGFPAPPPFHGGPGYPPGPTGPPGPPSGYQPRPGERGPPSSMPPPPRRPPPR